MSERREGSLAGLKTPNTARTAGAGFTCSGEGVNRNLFWTPECDLSINRHNPFPRVNPRSRDKGDKESVQASCTSFGPGVKFTFTVEPRGCLVSRI